MKNQIGKCVTMFFLFFVFALLNKEGSVLAYHDSTHSGNYVNTSGAKPQNQMNSPHMPGNTSPNLAAFRSLDRNMPGVSSASTPTAVLDSGAFGRSDNVGVAGFINTPNVDMKQKGLEEAKQLQALKQIAPDLQQMNANRANDVMAKHDPMNILPGNGQQNSTSDSAMTTTLGGKKQNDGSGANSPASLIPDIHQMIDQASGKQKERLNPSTVFGPVDQASSSNSNNAASPLDRALRPKDQGQRSEDDGSGEGKQQPMNFDPIDINTGETASKTSEPSKTPEPHKAPEAPIAGPVDPMDRPNASLLDAKKYDTWNALVKEKERLEHLIPVVPIVPPSNPREYPTEDGGGTLPKNAGQAPKNQDPKINPNPEPITLPSGYVKPKSLTPLINPSDQAQGTIVIRDPNYGVVDPSNENAQDQNDDKNDEDDKN